MGIERRMEKVDGRDSQVVGMLSSSEALTTMDKCVVWPMEARLLFGELMLLCSRCPKRWREAFNGRSCSFFEDSSDGNTIQRIKQASTTAGDRRVV